MRDLKNLIKSPTYHFTKLQNKLYGELIRYIEGTEGMSKTKFAEKLGVTKGYISQLLNEGADHKLSNFFKLSIAAGKIPRIDFLSPDEFLKEEMHQREENKQ